MSERYKPPGGNEWFYFTNINPNGEGSGSERGGEYGYWKQTTGGSGGEEEIKSEEDGRKIIGYKKTLVFYQQQQQEEGSSTHPIPDGSDGVVETDWMMYEYRLADPDPHSLPLIQPPPPRPKRKRGQLQLHTFIFSSSSSSSSSSPLPTRKIIGGGYNRKRASLLYQPSPSHPLAQSLKPNRRIVQELITVANPPLPHPPILTTHDHNMRVQLHTYSYSSLFSFFILIDLYLFISCLFVCCSTWMSTVLFYAESFRVVIEDPLAQAQALRIMHQSQAQAQAQALIFHKYSSFTLLLLLLIKPMMIISQLPVKLNVYKKNSLITHTTRLLIFLTHSKINNNKNSPLMFMMCPFKFFLRPEQMMHQPQPLLFQNLSMPIMIILHTKIMAPFRS